MTMQDPLDRWLNALGYDPASPSLHRPSGTLVSRHAYAPELHDLLYSRGEIRAEAVFDVEGVPTVSFFLDDGSLLEDPVRLSALRQRIWNQGLVSVLLVITPQAVVPVPVTPKLSPGEPLTLKQARIDGPLSRSDVQSGDLRNRYPEWFRLEDRVDRKLLANLRWLIQQLSTSDANQSALSRADAQYLVGQTLFVSYLEHRRIVTDIYRTDRGVGSFKELVASHDRKGLDQLLSRLKIDFNGDFLQREGGAGSLWRTLPDASLALIHDFLGATDLERAQPSFFPYNFRYIPVELLSGIYESFLGRESKKKLAAYYTPRHLANLVVTQALEDSPDLLAERIFDGACGSGILLTTAFRRMLGEAEARRGGKQLRLTERIELLEQHIFGSDLSDAAIRVTAFSLYLSLLERLEPADIAALCEDEHVKLPTLRGRNLFSGPEKGDFFSSDNPHLKRHDYTLCLSNPPWMEPKVDEQSSADTWAEEHAVPRALRQMAADFAWRAEDYLTPDGRLCLILPMSLLLKSTSQDFLGKWLTRVIWRRVINFGDLKELLFDDGRFSCVVLVAERRPPQKPEDRWSIPPTECFEYWVPKADIGLAFGRLTLHGVDRHRVQTQAIANGNRELVTRMWGDEFDLSLWAQLRLRGTFGDLFRGRHKRWRHRKGFHRTDNAVKQKDWATTEALWDRAFIRPKDLYDCPVVLSSELATFPRDEIEQIPRPVDDLMEVFEGPRILFPDGPAPDRSIRAAFATGPASFMSSVGVIAGPAEDEDLLRFATIYLRSDLVRYFMVTQLYQLLSDRDRVSLRDVDAFPFYLPDRHPNPSEAWEIVRAIAGITRNIEQVPQLLRTHFWETRRPEMEALLERYFGLDDHAQSIVQETVEVLLPATRPYGLSKVFELAQRRATPDQIEGYAQTLRDELAAWRDASHGTGEFEVDVLMTSSSRAGPFGIVRVTLHAKKVKAPKVTQEDRAVNAVLDGLHDAGLLPLDTRESMYFIPDTVIVSDQSVYLIKPQQQRLWLRRQARRDAERIVEATTGNAGQRKAAA